jgi:hypothetical protein
MIKFKMNANWTIKLIFKRFSANIKVSEREKREGG